MVNKYFLEAKKIKAKKRLGQNFLVDEKIIEKIGSEAESDDVILEIGPGLGFVTEKFIEKAKKVVAVELDCDAIDYLKKKFAPAKNFTLIENDILKTDLSEIFADEIKQGEKIKVIANIPYYITTPILLYLLGEIDDINNKNRNLIKEIVLMVQYEVAKRIVADETAKNKEYGLLSILSNFWAETSIILNVNKKCFMPSPKVDSAVVKFIINNAPKADITPHLRETIKTSFSMRRKNIKNNLKQGAFINVEEALEKAKIDPAKRAENLSIKDFYNLSLLLKKQSKEA